MRIGVIPTSALEWLVARLNLAPVPAVEALFGMLHSRIIMAGVRLGIFTALGSSCATAAELAMRLDLQPEGTRLLCNALTAAGYLRRDSSGRYRLRPIAQRYLVPSSPHYTGHYVEYNYDQWEWIARLEEIISTGEAIDLHRELGAPDFARVPGNWSRYLEGLADLAQEVAPEIAAKVPIAGREKGARRFLLDVGGGHGIFSAALCRRYPELNAEVLDLPQAVAAGEPIARRYAGPLVANRIRFRAGDALAGPLGAPDSYDAVLIFQLLHHLSPNDISGLLCRAVETLRPGGWLTVTDLLEQHAGRAPEAMSAYTALLFRVTSRGQSYTPEQIEDWLRAAGCSQVRRLSLLRVPGQQMITGQRAQRERGGGKPTALTG
jgi:ubiquinone/menaquinone biosynthesis C-methylase UbiE